MRTQRYTFRLKVLIFMLPLLLPIGSTDRANGRDGTSLIAVPHAPQAQAQTAVLSPRSEPAPETRP